MRLTLPVKLRRRAAVVAAVALVGVAAAALVLRPARVTVVEVARRDLSPVVHALGTVEAKTVVLVASKITGRVASVAVDQGDHVELGQVVVLLDDAELRADVQRAEAAVRAAQAQRLDVEAGARAEEIAEARANVDRARAQLDDLVAGARAPEIEELRERVRGAQATRLLAERDFHRASELGRRELIAAQEVDRARHAYALADAQEKAAAEALTLALQGSRAQQIASARAQLVATEARLDLLRAGPRPRQVEQVRAQVDESRAALGIARERLAAARITSPLNGAVVSRELEPGAAVNPGTPILKLVDPASVWVTVHVDERETGIVRTGDAVSITLRSQPDTPLPGRVARIRRESDRVTEQLAVDLAFDVPPSRLTLGEQVDAVLRPRPRAGAVAVPAGAVVRSAVGAGVWLVRDGRLTFRPVRLGAIDGQGWVEALEGVRPGEQVVDTPGRLADPANEGRRVSARATAREVTPQASP
jgi:HlyD family secretion protein